LQRLSPPGSIPGGAREQGRITHQDGDRYIFRLDEVGPRIQVVIAIPVSSS
jgi:hypothetical protein